MTFGHENLFLSEKIFRFLLHNTVFEPEVFRKQMYFFEKSAYHIVVTFWVPAVIRRPGNCAPCPLLTSLVLET